MGGGCRPACGVDAELREKTKAARRRRPPGPACGSAGAEGQPALCSALLGSARLRTNSSGGAAGLGVRVQQVAARRGDAGDRMERALVLAGAPDVSWEEQVVKRGSRSALVVFL